MVPYCRKFEFKLSIMLKKRFKGYRCIGRNLIDEVSLEITSTVPLIIIFIHISQTLPLNQVFFSLKVILNKKPNLFHHEMELFLLLFCLAFLVLEVLKISVLSLSSHRHNQCELNYGGENNQCE